MENKPLFDFSWPYRVDFSELANLEIDCFPAKVLYKSFFAMLNLPSVIVFSFIHLLSSGVESKHKYNKDTFEKFERSFF